MGCENRLMEFTTENILKAHEQFTGPDFPKLIARFKEMGMVKNKVNIRSGIVSYKSKNNEVITVFSHRTDANFAEVANKEEVERYLKSHQAGKTDFPQFCNDMAASGIYSWEIDLAEMTCSYLDKNKNVVLVESVPEI